MHIFKHCSDRAEVSGSSGIEAIVIEVGDKYIEVSMADWAIAFYEGECNKLYDYVTGSAIIGIVSADVYYDFNSYATQFYIHKSFAEAIAETDELASDIVDKIKLWAMKYTLTVYYGDDKDKVLCVLWGVLVYKIRGIILTEIRQIISKKLYHLEGNKLQDNYIRAVVKRHVNKPCKETLCFKARKWLKSFVFSDIVGIRELLFTVLI